ncbi:hypothetical protein YPPY71_0164, partial [Yersinia pestis PY-71]|jgi:hypothetical protein
MQQ